MNGQTANRTILVTGASGFLGSAVAARLHAQGCRLRTSGRRTSPPGDLPNYTAADLRVPSVAAKLLEDTDVVIHAAGLAHQHHAGPSQSDEFFRVNTAGTETMVRAARDAGCRRFVLVSSVSVYGNGSPPKTECDRCFPVGPYARSKFEAEQVASALAASANMELIILRMATLYGENDPGNVGRLLRAIDRGRFMWIGRGQNYKSLVHVEDAASACVLAATRQVLPQLRTFNISAEPSTMEAIVSTLVSALGRRAPSLQIPPRVPLAAAAVADKIPGLANRAQRFRTTLDKWLSDEIFVSTKVREAFGWRPRISLEDGLARQVVRYRLNQKQPSKCLSTITAHAQHTAGSRAA